MGLIWHKYTNGPPILPVFMAARNFGREVGFIVIVRLYYT